MALLLACGWAMLAAWLILRAAGQRDYFLPVEPARPPARERAPSVAVIVPARNEQANIESCVAALLRQSYPRDRMRVLVVDDHSEDATFAMATSLAQRQPRLKALRSPPLPAGWVGKCHACWIGAEAAPREADWLCFLDADVRAEPDLIASALATATSEGFDLLSLAPRQELGSFAERLVMPCGLYVLSISQRLERLQAPESDDATVTGQFMLVRRRAYDAVGGHAAVRAEIAEDVALGRLVKRAGWRVALRDGARLLSARMYSGWASLWEGVSKNLVDMLGGPAPTVATAVIAAALAWAALGIPAFCVDAALRHGLFAPYALAIALAASAAIFGLHVAGASYFRMPFWYGLLFPFGYAAGAAIAIDSVMRRARGQVSWKGRTYS